DEDRVEGCHFLSHPDELETSRKARRCIDKTIPRADIIVLDDAFQHRALKADINIVLVDYNRPLHKDKLLPFGRLRDLPERTRDADILIDTKCPSYLDEWEKGKWAESLGVAAYSPVTCKGRSATGKEQTLLFTTVDYKPMEPVFEEADSRFTYAKRLILFTGIAKDNVLRSYLSDTYKIIRRFSFPDHHRFTGRDLRALGKAIKASPTALICTTEKDAARLKGNPKTTLEIKQRLFQVPIQVQFLTPEEKEIFETTLLGAL
ncbi:MAG: tetraacyldisaccharide 4'-kinase, partial [Bacteroidales bacterium]|nr:tetraacyldisaccharide 4'-kinase [Bacteroidales bacterium]